MHRPRWVCWVAFALLCGVAWPDTARFAIVSVGGRNPRLYPSHAAAFAATPAGQATTVSADAILAKSRVVQDGVCAALEQQMWIGTERLPLGKSGFLARLLEQLLKRVDEPHHQTRYRAVGYVAAAIQAAGAQLPGLDPPAQQIADALLRYTDGDAAASRPPAYYAWSGDLTRIHRQDRLLQVPLILTPGAQVVCRDLGDTPEEQFAVARLIATTITADNELGRHHDTLMAYYRVLAGSPAALSVRDVASVADLRSLQSADRYAELATLRPGRPVEWQLLPHPFSREQWLAARVTATDGQGVLGSFVSAVRSGAISLKPTAQRSCFYDLDAYCLEPRIAFTEAPEARSIEPDETYAARLLTVFGADLHETRPSRSTKPAVTRPSREGTLSGRITVEPLPSVYLRGGQASQYLRQRLTDVLGRNTVRFVKALREGGSRTDADCNAELVSLEQLLVGCYAIACQSLDTEPDTKATGQSGPALSELAERAAKWLGSIWDDPDLRADVRSLTPLERRLDRRISYIATLGVRLAELEVSAGPGAPPSRAWLTLNSVAEGSRAGPVPDAEGFRKELDARPYLRQSRRAVNAQGERPALSPIGRVACICAVLVGLLIVIGGVAAALAPRRAPVSYARRRRRPARRPKRR